MANLRSYLADRPKGEFARSVGISAAYLSQILSGTRQPSLSLMVRVHEASGGEVDLNSWYPSSRPSTEASQIEGSLPDTNISAETNCFNSKPPTILDREGEK